MNQYNTRRSKVMRGFFVLLTTILVGLSVMSAYRSIRADYYVQAQLSELDLADDASTPQKKSEYLGKFLKRMESTPMAQYACWWSVNQNERTRVVNQIEVVRSLKQRCDELIKVDPSSMGYAQGMQQITGQEFDHTLAYTKAFFDKAISVQRGWMFWYGWWVFGLVALVTGITAVCWPAYVRRGPRAN